MDDERFSPSPAYMAWLGTITMNDEPPAPKDPAPKLKGRPPRVVDAGKKRAPDVRTPLEATADAPHWLAPSLRTQRKDAEPAHKIIRSKRP